MANHEDYQPAPDGEVPPQAAGEQDEPLQGDIVPDGWYKKCFPDKTLRADVGHGPEDLARKCGPGIKWAVLSACRLLLIYLLYPIPSYRISECPEDTGKPIGFAAPSFDLPLWLSWWAFWVPLGIYFQSLCLRYILGDHVRLAGTWGKPLGFIPLPLKCLSWHVFYQWLLTMNIIGALKPMGLIWNAEVLGMVLKTDGECPTSSLAVQELWSAALQQSGAFRSTLGKVGLDPSTSSFSGFYTTVYVLQLIQPIFAFIFSFKISTPETFDEVSQEVGQYTTLYEDTNDLAVLQVIADLGCMEAVTDHNNLYSVQRLHQLLRRPLQPGWKVKYLRIVLTQLEKAIVRFCLVGLVQNVLMGNIQCTLFAIETHLQGRNLTSPIFLNLALNVIGTLLAAGDIINFFKFLGEFEKAEESGGLFLSDDERRLSCSMCVSRLKHSINSKKRRFYVYLIIYVYVTVWTLVKFVAIFVCPTSLFDWGTGCVETLHA